RRILAELHHDLLDHLARMRSDREDDWVLVGLRLFECGKLAVEQRRGHKMTVACREPPRNQILFAFEIDKPDIAPLADENVAVGPFEGRAGDDTVITGASRRIDPGRDAVQPWSPCGRQATPDRPARAPGSPASPRRKAYAEGYGACLRR